MCTIKITPNDHGTPPGKLADAELHFDATQTHQDLDLLNDILDQLRKVAPNQFPFKLANDALNRLRNDAATLAGLKLIGFAIWETRASGKGRNVTFPARQYSINGERRSFALLRPIVDLAAHERIREQILDAYAQFVAARAAVGVA